MMWLTFSHRTFTTGARFKPAIRMGAICLIAWAGMILPSRADWLQDGGIVDVDSANDFWTDPNLGNNSQTLYSAFSESDGTNYQVFVKAFNGTDWEQVGGVLNINPSRRAESPSLAFETLTPYAVWYESNGSVYQIYVKYYNGSAWVQVGGSLNVNTANNAFCPKIAFSGTTPYVAWEENSGSARLIYVKHYNGAAWIQDGTALNINTANLARWPVWPSSAPPPMSLGLNTTDPIIRCL